jgi:excisionase family DNA binding protein
VRFSESRSVTGRRETRGAPQTLEARNPMTESARPNSNRHDGDRRPWPTASTGTGQPSLSEKSAPHHSGLDVRDSGHPATQSSFPPPPSHTDTGLDQNDVTGDIAPSTTQATGDPVPLLYTPTQAAAALQVRESWLRRSAARRDVPCTFLGKHLRFSRADLDAIILQAAHAATPPRRVTRRNDSPPSPGTGQLQRRVTSSRQPPSR